MCVCVFVFFLTRAIINVTDTSYCCASHARNAAIASVVLRLVLKLNVARRLVLLLNQTSVLLVFCVVPLLRPYYVLLLIIIIIIIITPLYSTLKSEDRELLALSLSVRLSVCLSVCSILCGCVLVLHGTLIACMSSNPDCSLMTS